MKQVPLRRFTTVVPFLTEDVIVTSDGVPIGTFTPLKESIAMDDIAKKAVQPDKVKVRASGELSKGLGPLPGEKPKEADPYQTVRPAPKPGK